MIKNRDSLITENKDLKNKIDILQVNLNELEKKSNTSLSDKTKQDEEIKVLKKEV